MGVFTLEKGNSSKNKDLLYYFNRIGVSVLFSGAAIGVSHVVQATRAGGSYGLAIIPVVCICLILKYPAFLFGPLYTSVTGESVISGYLRINKSFLFIIGLVFLSIMFTVVSAVSMLSAGILIETFQIPLSALWVSIILVFSSTLIVNYASFESFQRQMKYVFFALMVLTVISLVLAFPSITSQTFLWDLSVGSWTKQDYIFIFALTGWMPAGLDLPMMHSQWLIAAKANNKSSSPIEDFNFGYLSTAFLALVFILIGTIFFFGTKISFPTSAGGFAAHLLGTYKLTLGDWARVPAGVMLFLAIYSSLIIVLDGFPRVLSEVYLKWYQRGGSPTLKTEVRKTLAWIQACGAIMLLNYFASSLTALVDFATVTSFIVAALFAFLNHKLMFLDNFIQNKKISPYLLWWSRSGIASFITFAIFFLFINFNF